MFIETQRPRPTSTAVGRLRLLVVPVLERVRVWHNRHVARKMLRTELLQQPDSVLADSGWTRVTALKEARKPFWVA